MSSSTAYLTLKRAAQRLGVHEQTLRSWEKRKIIRMVRLPGSGYRRVPVEEVERLEGEMQAEPETRSVGVRMEPPRYDPDSLQRAHELAQAVRQELAGLDEEMTFDEFMSRRRGRIWSP